jgi:hypothetical protein
VSEEKEQLPIPTSPGTIYDSVVLWYLFCRNWEKAMMQAGFDPSDKYAIRIAQRRLAANKDFFLNHIKPTIEEGLEITECRTNHIENGLAHILDHYSSLAMRDRDEIDQATILMELEIDDKILKVKKGALEMLALAQSLSKPREAQAFTIV